MNKKLFALAALCVLCVPALPAAAASTTVVARAIMLDTNGVAYFGTNTLVITNGTLYINGVALSGGGGGKANAAGTNDNIAIFTGSTNSAAGKSWWDMSLSDFSNLVYSAGITVGGGGGVTWPLDAGGGAITNLSSVVWTAGMTSIAGISTIALSTGDGAALFDTGFGADDSGLFMVTSAAASLGGGSVGVTFTSVDRGNTVNTPMYMRGSYTAIGLSVTSDDGSGTDLRTGSLKVTGAVILSGLPGTDPAIAGALWNNAGVLTVSAGP